MGAFAMDRWYKLSCWVPLLLILAAVHTANAATPVFINELHYDNTGTDTGEAVEIAGPAGTDLSGWNLELYNGNGGASYDSISLSGTIPDQNGGYGTLSFATAGLQNGASDGIALVDNTASVVQFLSYEGSFTASGGPADGMASTDIGVSEPYDTPVGHSLQLAGTGQYYEDFAWQSASANSFGSINVGQNFDGSGCGSTPANLWINEIHYDNEGEDTGEFVEIAGASGTDLSCYSLVFYNGYDSQVYMTETLTGSLTDLGAGYGIADFAITGIQNDTEAIALVFDGTTVVQFLSYEGVITAADSPANGMTSTDIGVDEDPAPAAGQSIYLTGHGNQYEDFTWTGPDTSSTGSVNTGQTIDDSPSGGPFTIFHMNDAHSRLLPHDFDVPEVEDVVEMEVVGGAACFGAKMLALKSATPDSLILDAGDMSEGNPLGDLRGNGGIIDFYNLLDAKLKALGGRGIDAAVVGNHDVRSLQMLNNLKPAGQGGMAQFPAISVNICHEGTQTPYFDPYVLVTVNGTKVGILGYTNDESSYLGADTENIIDVVKCTWDGGTGMISIKSWVNTLRTTEGCDVVILLSHMGHSRITSGPDAVIADSGGVEPPEVVVSGHWHTWTERVWQPNNMNGKTLVTEAASYLQYIGELEVDNVGDYVQAQKHVIRNSEITPDLDVENLIANLITEYDNQDPAPTHGLYEVIGYSAVDLTMDKDKWWTVSEYPWAATNAAGAWITDAMVWTASQHGHPVDLALQSGGGIRRDIAAGEITYVEIYEAYPWSDDNMVRVQMTGQEIWDWIQEDHVGTSISDGWHVTAHDGQITAITFQGSPVNPGGTYNVAISEYMFAHPEITLSDTSPEDVGYSIREGVVDYTNQFATPNNPMYPTGITPRYNLNTEFAGGFKAVVTMIADGESQPYFEEAFIRFVEALPPTVARRNGYGLSELVNSDGSINLDHRFSEIMLYRSHLGFPDGILQPGDIIEVWGEGGSYDGTAEFIDQEGIYGPDQEFLVHGHDANLARPEYHATIASFWDEDHESHFVKFYAEKTGANSVRDSAGRQITVYEPGGYYTKSLPGSTGDILELTGVNTEDDTTRIFRCHTAVVASTVPVVGYPSTSTVDPISPYEQSANPITLTATASDVSPTGAILSTVADAQVAEGYPTGNYGSSTSMYVQSSTGSSYLDERAWTRFDLAGVIPDGATITSAKLRLYCWKAQGGDMDAAVHGVADGWTETGLTWSNQPSYGAALDTVTLANGQTSRWYEWDVTAFVSTEAAGDEVVTLMVKPVTENSGTDLTYAFNSKEYDGGALAPMLDIRWQESGSSYPVPTQVEFFYRHAPDGLDWSAWTPIGIDTTAADGWSQAFSYPQSQGYYEFYSISTDADANVEDAPIRADARVLYNNPPPQPADPSIPDGATNVSLNPTLSVTVSDSDGAPLDVCFYGDRGTGWETIGCLTDVASGSLASVVWSDLSMGSAYQWYVAVDDGIHTTDSEIWSFSTPSAAPVPALGTKLLPILFLFLVLFGVGTLRKRHHL
jgi:2',3'-cyclic-nucleotide 2'-phosphodiesterase (5'-nucleotidase family)